MFKRLFPSRWARIIAWTGAAVAWGTSVVSVQAASQQTESAPTDTAPPVEPEVEQVPEPLAVVPTAPEEGLVVIRYTPVPPPPPEIVTRTVTVANGGGGTPAPSAGGGERPTINDVVSSGS